MPKPYPPLQMLRPYPNDATRSYAACVDRATPYEGPTFSSPAEATEDAIFEVIKAAAKGHQACRFTVPVFAPEDITDVWQKLREVLQAIAPGLSLLPSMLGDQTDPDDPAYNATFYVALYDRSRENIPPSVFDEARDAEFEGLWGHMLKPPPTRH